jgi:hypothetical protein
MYLKIDPQIHWDIRIFFGQKRVLQQPASGRSGGADSNPQGVNSKKVVSPSARQSPN